MITNAVLTPGKPPKERYFDPTKPKPHEANFFPWLSTTFEENGIPSTVLVMPEPYHPVHESWCAVTMRQKIGRGTLMLGHSAGGEHDLRFLSERSELVIKMLVLIALWRDYRGKYIPFSDYEIDPNLGDRVTDGIIVITSPDDPDPSVHAAVERVCRVKGVTKIELPDYGHFMVPEIPELLDVLGLNGQSPTEPSSS